MKYELIAIKNGTEVNSYLVEAYSNLNHDLYSSSIQNIKNFTGTLNVYELNGNLIGQLVIFNGTAKNTSGKRTIEPLNKIINLFNLKQNKNNKVPACYESFQVFTVAYAYTNHYSSVTVGNYTHLTFVKTTLETTTTTSYMSSPYPCGTNGDSYHILQRTSTYRDVVDDEIINELTNPCAKKIFTDLQNGLYIENPLKPEILIPSNGIDLNFSQEILKLFKDSGNTNLTIRNDLLTGGANASTVGATITINNSYLTNATQLSVARTIIHEIVHVYLNAYFFGYPDFQDKPFQTQLRNYASEKGFTDINTFHHNFMGQYIDAVAYSLYEWDKEFGSGGNLGWEYYKSMAYSGMFQVDPSGSIVAEVDTFKEIVPNANDRQVIANIILNEQNGNNQSKGTKCD